MLYKLGASVVLVLIVAVLWAIAAIISNNWFAYSVGIQLISWLFIAALALWGMFRGVVKIWSGETLSDVLNSPWD